MRHENAYLPIVLVLILFSVTQTAAQEQPRTTINEKTVGLHDLKYIEPTIGETPDISENAKKEFKKMKKEFLKLDSMIVLYPDYETAKKHLTPTQIKIAEDPEKYGKEDLFDLSTWGCSWYCGGGPDSIFASSTLLNSNQLTYAADNAHDFSLATAWVEGQQNDGIGESITFRFLKKSPPVTTIKVFNGYMKSEKAWKNNSRVKELKLYVNEKPYAIFKLRDIKSEQFFQIDTLQGIDEDIFLKMEIIAIYKGDKFNDVAISEIEFDGTGVHCFAKGTLIATPNGQVEIEKLAINDTVFSFNEATKTVESATILALANQPHHTLYELNFSGQKITVTDDHPFFYDGNYYSIKKNKQYGVQTAQLKEGQFIDFFVNGQLHPLQLTSMKQLQRCELTYTITKLSKNKLFFANGACVIAEEIQQQTNVTP